MSMYSHLPAGLLIRRLAGFGVLAAAAGCAHDPPVAPLTKPSYEYLHLGAISPKELQGIVGSAVTPAPTVVVTDQTGSPVSGITVSFLLSRQDSSASIASATVVTDSLGVASAGAWTLGARAGWQFLTVTIRDAKKDSVAFRAWALPDVPVAVRMRPDQVGFVNDTLSVPGLRVVDRFGNGVEGVVLTLEVTGGGGTLEGRVSISNFGGYAGSGRWILGPIPGRNSVTATAVGVGKAVFSVDALSPNQVVWYDLETINSEKPTTYVIGSAYLALSDSGLFLEQITGVPNVEEYVERLSGRYKVSGLQLELSYFEDPADYGGAFGRDAAWVNGETLKLTRGDPVTFNCCAVWQYKKRSNVP
jgi:hypothetical protein